MLEVREQLGRRSDPAVLLRRLERAAHAGHARRRPLPPVRHVAARAHRVRGADRRRSAGALRQDAGGHLPGLSRRPADRPVGREPSASGIHLVPYVREAQKRGARLVVIDPRPTPLARQADLHLAPRPGTDVAVALAIHRHLFESGLADRRFSQSTRTAPTELRERAAAWTFERAAEVCGRPEAALRAARRRLRAHIAGADPLRLGPRAQPQRRQRRDGDPRAARSRRKVRCARRRVHDEQLRRVEPHAPMARAPSPPRASST